MNLIVNIKVKLWNIIIYMKYNILYATKHLWIYTLKQMSEFWRLELNLIPLKQCLILYFVWVWYSFSYIGLTSKSLAITSCDIWGLVRETNCLNTLFSYMVYICKIVVHCLTFSYVVCQFYSDTWNAFRSMTVQTRSDWWQVCIL